jgi:arylsulfatase A-like enzyme
MRWPGRIPAGRRVSGLVQQVDLLPTILEAARSGAPAGIDRSSLADPEGLDGKSLWEAIRGKTDGAHETVYLSECAWQAARGIRTADYKFIRTYDPGPFDRPPRELYDLAADPAETVNLADLQPELADRFERQLDSWVESKLAGREDPMEHQLKNAGLPFRRRIDQILASAGMSWEEWCREPQRKKFDSAVAGKR